jgi:phosphoserine phosphatase
MKKNVIVFDFDKTLTDRDTLFGFYRIVAGSDRLFLLKRIVLLVAGVLYKAGLIKNNTLKRLGIFLFLKGRPRSELEVAAKSYAQQIELNDIYYNHYDKVEGEKWIVSASPEIYLRYLFTAENVAGTTFTYSGGNVKGLGVNMFGWEKKKYLNEKGIYHISELYTDSMTDKPLMDIAEKVFLVKDGNINTYKDKNE